MNEEEIKAIIFTKHFLKDDEGVFAMGKKETQTLLNLIEKQQKELGKKEHEIKELKKQLISLTYKSSVKGVRR